MTTGAEVRGTVGLADRRLRGTDTRNRRQSAAPSAAVSCRRSSRQSQVGGAPPTRPRRALPSLAHPTAPPHPSHPAPVAPRTLTHPAPPAAGVGRRILAAQAFANWTAFLGFDLRAWIASIDAARALHSSGRPVGHADLLLRHLADARELARIWSGAARG